MNDEEIKNEFINCIEGTHTLNLAISVLEDREEYKKEIDRLNNIIKEVREYIAHYVDNEYRNGRDDELYLELNEKELKEFLEILDKGEDKI